MRFFYNSLITPGVKALKNNSNITEEGVSWQFCHCLYFQGLPNARKRDLVTFASPGVQVYLHHRQFAPVSTTPSSCSPSCHPTPQYFLCSFGSQTCTHRGTHTLVPASFICIYPPHTSPHPCAMCTYPKLSTHSRSHACPQHHLVFYRGNGTRHRSSPLPRHSRCTTAFEGGLQEMPSAAHWGLGTASYVSMGLSCSLKSSGCDGLYLYLHCSTL